MQSATNIPTSNPTSVPKNRLDYIDGMRGYAALNVVFGHCYQSVYWGPVLPNTRLLIVAQWVLMGHSAVVAFIVISGFCLMRPVLLSGGLRGGAKAFYKGRALRILPAYYASVAVALLLITTLIGQKHSTLFDLSLPLTGKGILGHLLLINNVWPPPGTAPYGNLEINLVYWTIALEWQIYWFFPLFVRLWQRQGIKLTLIAGMAVVCVLHWLTNSRTGSLCWSGLNFPFYAYFLLGVCAAYCVFGNESKYRNLPWPKIALVFCGLFYLLYHWQLAGRHGITMQHADIACSLLTMSALVAGSQGYLRFFTWKPLVRIGHYSYSLYLLHLPLLIVVVCYVIQPLHLRSHFASLCLVWMFVPVVLWISRAFSHIFEDKKVLTICWMRLTRRGN